jgi:hypothetical protein
MRSDNRQPANNPLHDGLTPDERDQMLHSYFASKRQRLTELLVEQERADEVRAELRRLGIG